MVTGRPTIYSEELADLICERLADGESLIKICADDDMPSRRTVRLWCREKEDFFARYTRARLDQAHSISDEVFDLARGEDSPTIAARANALLAVQARLAPREYGPIQRTLLGQDPDAGAVKIEVCYVETNTAEAE